MKNRSLLVRCSNAWAGFVYGLRNERSLRFQVGVALAVAVTLAIIQPGAVWIALVALASGAVIAAELFNTAVEHLADHLHPEQHPAIGVVKDCAAAASLISAVVAVGVGVCLLVHLYSL